MPKLEPHLTQLSLNIPIPPFLGALAWKLRYSRTFHRKARLWATAALALLSLRAAWNYTVFYGDELRTQSCVASESHLKGSSFAFGAVTRASCESRCDIWRAEQSGARKRWGCFWGDEAIP